MTQRGATASMASYLVETSVVTRLHLPVVRRAVQPYVDTASLVRCELTDLEIGFSASNAADWDRLQRAIQAFDVLAVTPTVVARAKAVQRLLAAAGLKGRKVPDLIIAASAELADVAVLHYDVDFELIAGVTGQRHEWIVPRGSID